MPPLDLREWGKVTGGGAPPGALYIPATIPDLLAAWDPAPAYVTTVAGPPTRLRNYFSREGNGYELEQLSGPAQFEWSATGILGKPAIYGDGARLISGAAALAGLMSGATDYTRYWIAAQDAALSTHTHVATCDSGVSTNLDYTYGSAADLVHYRHPTAKTYVGAVAAGPRYYAVTRSGSNVTLYSNGVASSTTAIATNPTVDLFALGSRRFNGSWATYMLGWIGTVLCYGRALSAGELATLNTWATTEYPGL